MSRFEEVIIKGTEYRNDINGIDAYTEAQINIPWSHHMVHAGYHFFVMDYTTSLAAAATVKFTVVTPDTTTAAHMIASVYSSLGATVEVHYNPSGISGGSAVTPINSNPNNNHSSVLSILKDPTIATPGTRITGFLAGGSRNSGTGGREQEWILRRNSTYSFTITSLANANEVSWDFEWYELENKN